MLHSYQVLPKRWGTVAMFGRHPPLTSQTLTVLPGVELKEKSCQIWAAATIQVFAGFILNSFLWRRVVWNVYAPSLNEQHPGVNQSRGKMDINLLCLKICQFWNIFMAWFYGIRELKPGYGFHQSDETPIVAGSPLPDCCLKNICRTVRLMASGVSQKTGGRRGADLCLTWCS